MADVDQPSLGEVLRRLDEVSRQLAAMMMEIKEDRAAAARLYVPRELYETNQKFQNSISADLHRDVGTVDAKVDAVLVKALAAVNTVKVDADNKFGVIASERKADVDWKRQITLFVAGTFVTVLLAIAGFAFTLATR